jgi:hypothetical protein
MPSPHFLLWKDSTVCHDRNFEIVGNVSQQDIAEDMSVSSCGGTQRIATFNGRLRKRKRWNQKKVASDPNWFLILK